MGISCLALDGVRVMWRQCHRVGCSETARPCRQDDDGCHQRMSDGSLAPTNGTSRYWTAPFGAGAPCHWPGFRAAVCPSTSCGFNCFTWLNQRVICSDVGCTGRQHPYSKRCGSLFHPRDILLDISNCPTFRWRICLPSALFLWIRQPHVNAIQTVLPYRKSLNLRSHRKNQTLPCICSFVIVRRWFP